MRRSRFKIFHLALYATLAIFVLLSWTVFRGDTIAWRAFYTGKVAFSYFTSIAMGLMVVFLMYMWFERGRSKGIRELADEMMENPEDYYDDVDGEKIPVVEKHSTGSSRKAYKKILRYDEKDK